MTTAQFLTAIREVTDRDGTSVTVGGRGHGSVKLVTRDSHAAHAFQLHANRAGLRVRISRPDDGSYVLGISGFRFVPSGPLHTCDRPGADRATCPACTGR